MEVTWIAILASLCMGIGAALVFVFAVKKNYFKDVEDAKYHVFWSDVEEMVDSTERRDPNEEVEDDEKSG
ncbi:MAG: hypothetical protein WBQ72_14360 [Terriglobales bacterium]|jgi:nitrogen fixation-related uncharacterized protein